MLPRKCLGLAAGGFVDPRAGKTSILLATSFLQTTLTACTRGPAIVGPDGVTLDAYRITSNGGSGSGYFNVPQLAAIANGQKYTSGAYIKTTSAALFGLGNSSVVGFTPFQSTLPLPSMPGWTLYEVEQTATANIAAGSWAIWFGLGSTFSTNEWIELARPMVYLGNKVT